MFTAGCWVHAWKGKSTNRAQESLLLLPHEKAPEQSGKQQLCSELRSREVTGVTGLLLPPALVRPMWVESRSPQSRRPPEETPGDSVLGQESLRGYGGTVRDSMAKSEGHKLQGGPHLAQKCPHICKSHLQEPNRFPQRK